MKTIVIAAGYATRLGELTRNFPKPLLKIGSNTILGRMLDDIDQIPDITEHIIITNHKFAHFFEEWADDSWKKPITIVDDGTSTNETRLGAVCDLLFAMEKLNIDDDLLVVAADNLLFFSFQEFVDFAKPFRRERLWQGCPGQSRTLHGGAHHDARLAHECREI